MNLPEMVSTNTVRQLTRRIEQLETTLRQLAAATGTLGAATISGDLKVEGGGSISVADGGNIFLSDDGKFFVAGDTTYVQILEDSFSIGTIVGGTLGRPSMILKPDGFLAAISDTQYAVFRVDATDGAAIITSSVGIVRLPYSSTGSAANTRILLDGTIQMVVSSRRYKEDIADAVVDPAEVRQLRRRSWVDKGTVERMGEAGEEADVPRNLGFIAEELDELPSMRQFVDYVEVDGDLVPDAIQYDRLTVALHALAMDQQEQIDNQQAQIDVLTARLDALDGGTPTQETP